MRILQINNQHYLMGGAHRVYLDTAELLRKNGHDVFVYSLKEKQSFVDENDDFFPEAVDFRGGNFLNKIVSIKKFINNRKAATQLKKYIKKIKPEVAHVHLFMGGLTTSILKVLKECKIPVVHTVHDYRLICPSYLFLDGNNKICEKCKNGRFVNCVTNKCSDKSLAQSGILALDAYYRKYVMNPNNYISRYIFVSAFIANKHDEFQKGIKLKSVVLHNFISNLEDIAPNSKNGKYFLYLGRLSREKGVDTLISAAEGANINLKIVGNGPLLERRDSCKNKNIEFLGFKNGSELWNIVKNASFVIVPSEWYENNPLSILESYAYGKPVIGSNIGGIPEIVQHNKTGYLFEQGSVSGLQEILVQANAISEEEYEIFSQNARCFAEDKFNPVKHYKELMNIYKEVIK
uniref:glycosyltransferase n=1 Tax=Polaribacter sp. TaxID=1920175 RepID=UPI004047FF07